MKKILIAVLMFFVVQNSVLAQQVSFVYINGANNNDEKMTKWFMNGVKKLHPVLKKTIDNDKFMKDNFLQKETLKINQEPVIFFWGDKSAKDLEFVEKELAITKLFSPWMSYLVRSMITHFLHDAIWVQKTHNMARIVEELHSTVKSEAQKGNKTVLYGYSAGSFVTYEYLLTRLPFVNTYSFFQTLGASSAQLAYIKKNPTKNTCMAAYVYSDIAIASASGNIIPNVDFDGFKENYKNLDKVTDEICIPDKSVIGVVNFASPLVLFYSDISDPNFKLSYYNKLMYEYIIENGIFWLTVNYREDPLAFPVGKNLSIEELEKLAKLDIEPHQGFMFDKSDTRGHRPVFLAHTSYWSTRKNFSKAIVRAYTNGYKYNYDDTFVPKDKKKFINYRKLIQNNL